MSGFASLEALQLDTAFLRHDGWGEWKEMNDMQVQGDPVSEYGMTSAFLRHDGWGEWKEMNDVQVRGGPVSEYGMTSAFLRYDSWVSGRK